MNTSHPALVETTADTTAIVTAAFSTFLNSAVEGQEALEATVMVIV
jgi:hypothetical protein